MFSLGSVGSLLGALTAGRISARFGIGPATIGVTLVPGPALLLVPLAPVEMPLPFLVVTTVMLGFAIVVYNIIQVSFRQAICPERLQGRMNSVMRFIVWGTIPIGSLAGGALGTWVGLRAALTLAPWVAGLPSSGSCSRPNETCATSPG
jgi:MFS family permease